MPVEPEFIAFIASMLGVGGTLPQIIKIIRTGDTRALSYPTYLMWVIGSMLWVSYGLAEAVYSIVFWNCVSFMTAMTVINLKFKNENKALFDQDYHSENISSH